MPLWHFDRHQRLAAARDHAAAICEALRRRRCDHLALGDRSAVLALEARLAVHTARWRRLSQQARTARGVARGENALSVRCGLTPHRVS